MSEKKKLKFDTSNNNVYSLEVISLNKFEKFNFDFQVIKRLKDFKDTLTYKNENEFEVLITSNTQFNIEVNGQDFITFEKIMDKMVYGERISAIEYKKTYLYEHQFFSFEGYGAFPVSIEYPELNHNSNSGDVYNIELQSDYVKLNIKDLKSFLEFFKMNPKLIKKIC